MSKDTLDPNVRAMSADVIGATKAVHAKDADNSFLCRFDFHHADPTTKAFRYLNETWNVWKVYCRSR